jgi:RimJ/RimL family protein N-acetyltransferase
MLGTAGGCPSMIEQPNQFGQPTGNPVPGWSARPRPARAVIAGRYCRLEPIDVNRHAPELFAHYMQAPDARDWTYLFHERPETLGAFRTYLAELARSEDPLHFTIVDLTDNGAVGTAALHRIDCAHGVIEVGSITYSPRMKRTRAGTEVIYLFMRLAFDELGYRRFEWKCDSLNAPSRAAAERFGFTFEGVFRRAIVYKSRNRDTAWYSVIAEEWPRIRKAFEAWLSPENFDQLGRQRRSLREIRAAIAPSTG